MTLYELFKVSSLPLTAPSPFKITSASGNGVTDDTAAIQSDLNSLSLGGHLLFPPGVYRLTSTLVINKTGITVEGMGNGTQFLADGDYGHVFDARPDSDPTVAGAFTDVRFLSFYIASRSNRTKGSAIHTKWTHAATFRDVRIGTLQYNDSLPVFFWDGITLENESAAVVDNCQIYARHYGVYFSGHKVAETDHVGTNYWYGLVTGGTNIWGDHATFMLGSAGVFLAGGTGGVQLEDCNISYYENGVHVTGQNRELFLGHAFSADDVGGHGVLVDSAALFILQITGGWAAGCGRVLGGDGIHVSDGNSGLQTKITGGTFYANIGNGIYIGDGTAIICGAAIYQNSGSDVVFGTNATAACITGCFVTTVDNGPITPSMAGNVLGIP